MCQDCISKAKKVDYLKKNGNLKKIHKDLPRYKCIVEYEKYLKDSYEDMIKKMLYQISKKIVLTVKK